MSLGHGAARSIAIHGGNPQCIFSLRQLARYAGPVLKIRRSSDNVTELFYFSTNRYGINEEEILDFVGANDGFVETWYDQSVGGRHATNTTTAQQPKIATAGTIEKKNGRPTILFSGSQRLNVTATTTFGSSFGVFQRNSVASVISETTSGGAAHRGLFPGNADDLYWVHSDYSTNGGTLVNRSTTTSPLSGIVGANLFQASGFGTPDNQPVMVKTHALGFGTPGYAPLTGVISEILVFPTDVRDKRGYIEQNQKEYYLI
jgi:hypothetical protein